MNWVLRNKPKDYQYWKKLWALNSMASNTAATNHMWLWSS